jgi:CheY-like chemotaxis protein
LEEESQPHAARVVVIDDDPMFVDLVSQLLSVAEGHEVLVPDALARAVPYVKKVKPDLVILDVLIGREQRGWEILAELGADPNTRAIPVVVCSAAVQSVQSHAEALSARGVRTLLKPFDIEDLLQTIREALAE